MPTDIPSIPWTCNPSLGIIHSEGCDVCLSYIRHFAAAIEEVSLQQALKQRDSQLALSYLNGFNDGENSYLNRQRSNFHIEQDEALALESHNEALLNKTREELRQVKEQLSTLQALFEEVVDTSAFHQQSFNNCMMVPPYDTPSETILPPGPLDDETYVTTDSRPCTSVQDLPTPPPSPRPLSTSLAGLSNFHAGSQSHPRQPEGGAEQCGNQSRDAEVFGRTSFNIASSHSSGNGTSEAVLQQQPGSILELQALLSSARAGDQDALTRVNGLHIKAQFTPPEDRSLVQQFLLLEWQSPQPPSSTASIPRQDKFSASTPEVFVDASAWGIGFVFNGRWLAWQLKPGWKAMGRDNNWAEMIAVELGLRVAIAAGFTSQTVVIRSDNSGVIQALMTGKSKHSQHPVILERITELSKRHTISISPIWVSTKENPADNPSRAKFPPPALRFPTTISVPLCLKPFLHSSV